MNCGIYFVAAALIVWNLFQRPTIGIFAALGLGPKERPILLDLPISAGYGNFSHTEMPGCMGVRARVMPVVPR